MERLSSNLVFQNAWVVADFDQAVDYWTSTLGVGPFFVLDYVAGPELTYRGAPGALKMRVAWAQAGDVQVELIDPVSSAPNVYRDLVPAGQTRFHHVCLWSDDMDADLAAMAQAGFPLAMSSGPGAARFAYFDTSAANGHMVEILERGDGIVAMFDRVKASARSWDGKNPVRAFAELAG